jgi:hypothetical protein
VLCQIEKVCRYADRFDRTVIIDTNHHSTGSIKDHFSRYFVSKQKRLVLDLTAIEFALKNGGVVPSFIASELFQYDAHFDHELGCFVEKTKRLPITFDFTKDYAEPLLVHHGSGRLRGASVAALSRLRLRDDLTDELIERLKSIGSNYVSVHIRNTDYKTNYRPLLDKLRSHPALLNCKKLFVATDDISCLEACRAKLPGFNVISFSKLPHESGRPIHRLTECDDVCQRNKDAILDLLMLALSQEFMFFEVNQNRWGARYSGFSVLALDLRNSKAILSELISRPKTDMPSWLLTR